MISRHGLGFETVSRLKNVVSFLNSFVLVSVLVLVLMCCF